MSAIEQARAWRRSVVIACESLAEYGVPVRCDEWGARLYVGGEWRTVAMLDCWEPVSNVKAVRLALLQRLGEVKRPGKVAEVEGLLVQVERVIGAMEG